MTSVEDHNKRRRQAAEAVSAAYAGVEAAGQRLHAAKSELGVARRLMAEAVEAYRERRSRLLELTPELDEEGQG